MNGHRDGGRIGRGLRVRAEFAVSPEMLEHFYAGAMGDLSYGGVFLPGDDPPAAGAEVTLAITLPDGSRIEADGLVRWARPRGEAQPAELAGCEIVWQAVGAEAAEAVRAFVSASDYTFVVERNAA
jgi:Tfp pilus assembly protein PilZ